MTSRPPLPPGPARPSGTTDETERLRDLLDERTADLYRLKAEYDNYRKRVHRDRKTLGRAAAANVLRGMLPVLDAIDGTRAAGDNSAGFERVAALVEQQLGSLGLVTVGRAGEPFDPARHEAVLHVTRPGTDTPTCLTVHRPGYRMGDQLLRPAQVTVCGPPSDIAP